MSSISEKDFIQLNVSITKALNPMEAPLKIKHARSVIITTHHTREAKSFWQVASRQPLMEHRFTAWKFCHLLHKVLREGHPSALKHSQTHKKMITEMGKLWGHLKDGVGTCIQLYSRLIVVKLDFHDKNSLFPGSLIIDFNAIKHYAGNDINVYFQLCVEIYDYLDEIINVQEGVFSSINSYRMSSMTPQGQCRLAPLITLIQDSNPLYDICVRLMFKLHDELPSDVLGGHRDRFRGLFIKLKHFYDNVRPLQYFADLIQVPHLPDTAPNFTSKVDFGSYIPPVVFVQSEPEIAMGNIVDTQIEEETPIHMPAPINNDEIFKLENVIREKENHIAHLQNELSAIKDSFEIREKSHKKDANRLQNEIIVLSNELTYSKEICKNVQLLKDDLELQLANAPTLIQKATEEEEKAKASTEKFSKLKSMYSEIRQDHINLLRQQSDSTRQLNKEKQENSNLASIVEELKKELGHCKERAIEEQVLQEKNSELQQKFEELKNDYEILTKTNEILKQDHEKLGYQKNLEVEQLNSELVKVKNEVEELQKGATTLTGASAALELKFQDVTKKHELLLADHNALQQKNQEFCSTKTIEVDQLTAENEKLNEEIVHLKNCNKQIIHLEALLSTSNETLSMERTKNEETIKEYEKTVKSKIAQFEEFKQKLETDISQKSSQINELQQSFDLQKTLLDENQLAISKLTNEKQLVESEIQDMLQQNSDLEGKLNAILLKNNTLLSEKEENDIRYKSLISALIHCVLKAISDISASKFNEPHNNVFDKANELCDDLENILNKLSIVYKKYSEEKNCPEGLIRKSILCVHKLALLHEQCVFIYNTATDIEKGEGVLKQMNNFSAPTLSLLQLFYATGENEKVDHNITTLKSKIVELKQSIEQLNKSFNSNLDIGDQVEKELEEMDKSIQEAAEKFVQLLTNARSKDNGIKLEVNEKILDACTVLMECIKMLIQKSRFLQEEIVSNGRGRSSAKDFYKRNSQWTEGLISASKSVAKGANLLVEAANKAVSSDKTLNFEIVAAAQEIAACTAQLVIASRVKAPRESLKLIDLTKASRNVSEATGAVVATVKDCIHHLERSQEVDLTKLTSSQAKALEIEIQVKVLELEHALELERLKLSSFRRNHYQNSED